MPGFMSTGGGVLPACVQLGGIRMVPFPRSPHHLGPASHGSQPMGEQGGVAEAGPEREPPPPAAGGPPRHAECGAVEADHSQSEHTFFLALYQNGIVCILAFVLSM